MDDAQLDELFGGDPAQFTARRDALAKELRKAGDREAADAVKALRRPSAAAAIVNRLARERRAELRAVLDAGAELAAAQAAAVGGRAGGDELRGAQRALRAAIEGLVAEATRGASATTAEKVRETLQAAAGHEELRAVVAAGRLEREASAAGFGGLDAALIPAPARSSSKGAAKGKGKGRKGSAEEDAAAAERARAAEEVARRKARERAQRRRRELRAAKEAEAAAAQELAAAQAALVQVEAALRARRKDVAQAEKAAERARQRRERLEAEAAEDDG